MNGTPYWGNTTFSDIRSIPEFKNTILTLEKIEELALGKGITVRISDMYSLFFAIASMDWLFIIEDKGLWLSWCKDIRFNYRDRKVFVPYFTYSTELVKLERALKNTAKLDLIDNKSVNVKYNYELNMFSIDDRTIKSRVSSISLYDPSSKSKYEVGIAGLPYLSRGSFSLDDLHDRYLESCYVDSPAVDFYWERYVRIDKKYKDNREHALRKNFGLPTYSKVFNDIRYVDVRQYTYEDIYGTPLVPDDVKPLWLRSFRFEAFLYCIFAQGIGVEDQEYVEMFDKLGKSLRFLTFTKNDKSLVLKHYYMDNTSIRKKSYERYGLGS